MSQNKYRRETLQINFFFKSFIFIFFTTVSWLVTAVEPITIGERHVLTSKKLHEDISISVYLPRSYERASKNNYDVLYLLDGNANLLHAAGSQYFLAGYRQMPELIIVGLNSNNRDRDFTPSSVENVPNSGGADRFRQFISEELFPFVNENFRVTKMRYLSGHSYGGLFAIDTMIKNTTMFDAYFTFSPSLRWDNDLVLNQLLAKVNKAELTGYLYANIGDEGYLLRRPILALDEALKANKNDKLRWEIDWLNDENHSTTPVIGQFLAYRDYFLKK
ncbi:alpha/beta hydrolase [Colwelliaceae bacterium 6441]